MTRMRGIHDHARNESLWLEQTAPFSGGRRPENASRDVDVLIIGGGFTGLWTAYSLALQEPGLRIALHEARHIGFGASGRNGGWAVGMLSGQSQVLKACGDIVHQGRIAQSIAATVDYIGKVAQDEGIDCGYAKGGMLRVAALGHRQKSAFDGVLKEHLHETQGLEAPLMLDADEAAAKINMDGTTKGFLWPHCAAINPAQLAVGLAEACARRGVEIIENSAIQSIDPHQIRTSAGVIRASRVVAATEGYSADIGGIRSSIIPVYSLLLATRPLTESEWAAIGLADREVFSDCSPISTYGQRSADGRLVFGAFGLYPLRHRIGASAADFAGDFRLLERYLKRLFPVLRNVEVTHRWTGTLGVPRTMRPAVGITHDRQIALAGGYVARGVVGSCVFGKVAASVILDRAPGESLPLPLPFEHAFPKWEGPVLRYLGTALSLNPDRWAEHVQQSNMPRPIKSASSWLAANMPAIVH